MIDDTTLWFYQRGLTIELAKGSQSVSMPTAVLASIVDELVQRRSRDSAQDAPSPTDSHTKDTH